jgi:hypothetical protein
MTELLLLCDSACVRRALSRSGLWLLLAATSLSACTEFADGEDVGPSNMDFMNNPAGSSGQELETANWSCLGSEPAPPPAALGTTTVTYTILIVDTVTREPPAGLVVNACSSLDIECASPMVASIRPDADGMVRAHVPINFSGFFTVESDQTVPAALFIAGALEQDTTATTMLVIGEVAFTALARNQGVALDPQMGQLLLRAFDCDGKLTPGVRFSDDRGGQPYAFVDGLPVVGQTVTDAQGTAGFLNVLPGLAVVQSIRASDNAVTQTASGRVRPGWFTYLDLAARP